MIVKLLHEGETTIQLKNVIRYNTVDKEYLNSIDNPRLLQAVSNLGIIDITDKTSYQDFMLKFISEISLNKSISTNKRQKKLYAHEVVSFEDGDNSNYTQDELIKIAIETLNSIYDMDNTPYILWPQVDSGRLHFHIVRSEFNNMGAYQRVKNSKLKMRSACEKIELKYSLTLTGKNVSDEIRQANNPMLKVMKNCKLEAQYNHQKNISEAINQDMPLSKIKRKSYNLLMDDTYQSEAENVAQQNHLKIKNHIESKQKVNDKIENIKSTLFTLYKESKDETDFIEAIETQGITMDLLKHAKSGKSKGIVFHYQGESISGGKISSSMTLGKIKKRFPNFIHTLEKPPSLRSTFNQQRNILDFHIEQISKYYKQRNNNNNGDILIYFGKKNIEARPYNYNLKLSSNKDSIRFGPATPNDLDLTLSINVALENGWKGAILTNSSTDFLKRMMKVAYDNDPDLLFFVKSDKTHQLRYADLKEIKPELTADNLKTALKNKLIAEKDLQTVHQDLVTLLKSKATQPDQQGYALALEKGFKLEELDKKTPQQLQHFYHHKTFNISNKTALTKKEIPQKHLNKNDREECLEKLKNESDVELVKKTKSNDEIHKNRIRPI